LPPPFNPPSPDQDVNNNSFINNTFTGNGTAPDPGAEPFEADVFFLPLNHSGNCESGNTFVTEGTMGGFAALPACPTPPVQPGCPFVPPPTTTSTTSTTSTMISTTTSTSVLYTWTQVQALLASSCTPCHTTSSSGGLTGLNDYNVGYTNTVNAPSSELPTMDRIEPSDSANSYLMHELDGTHLGVGGSGVQMPAFSTPLAEDVRNSIRAWINSGAPQN